MFNKEVYGKDRVSVDIQNTIELMDRIENLVQRYTVISLQDLCTEIGCTNIELYLAIDILIYAKIINGVSPYCTNSPINMSTHYVSKTLMM